MTTTASTGKRVPLYQQAADSLRGLILNGSFDSVLPSQDALCQILHVSRPTVREAIRVLERTGLVSSRQGVGTVINRSKPDIHPGLEILLSTTDVIRGSGYTAETAYAEVRRMPATKGMYPAFADLPIITIERVRTADAVPLVFSIDIIPDRGYDIEDLRASVTTSSFMAWMEAHGAEVEYARTELTAKAADQALAELLHVPLGTALLLMEEVGYGTNGQPVYASNDFYRCDLAHFHVVRRRGYEGMMSPQRVAGTLR